MENIIADSVTTAEKHLTASLRNFDADALLVKITVGGVDHVDADFTAQTITARLKNDLGVDLIIANQVPLGDFMVLTDYKGGFSKALKVAGGTLTGDYHFLLPLANMMLSGNDSLEIDIHFPGDATATYDIRVGGVDMVTASEHLVGYESVVGVGQEINIRDCEMVYLCTAPDGSQISYKDEVTSGTDIDYDLISLGACTGRIEEAENFGVAWNDEIGFSQNLSITVPTGARFLIQKRYFPNERQSKKERDTEAKVNAFIAKMRSSNPAKFNFLKNAGEL